MSKDRNRPSNCKEPIDSGLVAEYWLAVLAAAEEEAIEEHLLGWTIAAHGSGK